MVKGHLTGHGLHGYNQFSFFLSIVCLVLFLYIKFERWRTTAVEDDCGGGLLRWRTTAVEDHCGGGLLRWRTTAVEDYCGGGPLRWKTTAVEDYCGGGSHLFVVDECYIYQHMLYRVVLLTVPMYIMLFATK